MTPLFATQRPLPAPLRPTPNDRISHSTRKCRAKAVSCAMIGVVLFVNAAETATALPSTTIDFTIDHGPYISQYKRVCLAGSSGPNSAGVPARCLSLGPEWTVAAFPTLSSTATYKEKCTADAGSGEDWVWGTSATASSRGPLDPQRWARKHGPLLHGDVHGRQDEHDVRADEPQQLQNNSFSAALPMGSIAAR